MGFINQLITGGPHIVQLKTSWSDEWWYCWFMLPPWISSDISATKHKGVVLANLEITGGTTLFLLKVLQTKKNNQKTVDLRPLVNAPAVHPRPEHLALRSPIHETRLDMAGGSQAWANCHAGPNKQNKQISWTLGKQCQHTRLMYSEHIKTRVSHIYIYINK